MVEREVIRRIIIEGQEFVNEISLTERPFFFEQKGNYVFVGIRQAGKSYLLYQRTSNYYAKSITSMKLFISILTMSASDK